MAEHLLQRSASRLSCHNEIVAAPTEGQKTWQVSFISETKTLQLVIDHNETPSIQRRLKLRRAIGPSLGTRQPAQIARGWTCRSSDKEVASI